jgi:hypothetical protein
VLVRVVLPHFEQGIDVPDVHGVCEQPALLRFLRTGHLQQLLVALIGGAGGSFADQAA